MFNKHFFYYHSRYVQHLIKKESDLIWTCIAKGGRIFLAGSSDNMPQGVKDALKEIYINKGGMNETTAQEFQDKLEIKDIFQSETWS